MDSYGSRWTSADSLQQAISQFRQLLKQSHQVASIPPYELCRDNLLLKMAESILDMQNK